MSISTFIGNIFPRFYTRKIHLYCIGAAKTGTTSVAAMFSSEFRSAHEQDIQEFNHKLINYLEGKIDLANMTQYILERDRLLNLDVESSHPMAYISDILTKCFPDAKFIITIREPYSWLQSRLNYHNRVDPPEWREYRHYFWIRHQHEYSEEEEELEKYGLCSLDVYLSQYADHYHRILRSIPEERRLIVKTNELASLVSNIAKFAGVDFKLLHPSHSNRENDKILPLEKMNANYVRSKIWAHCESLIKDYFPESISDYKQSNIS